MFHSVYFTHALKFADKYQTSLYVLKSMVTVTAERLPQLKPSLANGELVHS